MGATPTLHDSGLRSIWGLGSGPGWALLDIYRPLDPALLLCVSLYAGGTGQDRGPACAIQRRAGCSWDLGAGRPMADTRVSPTGREGHAVQVGSQASPGEVGRLGGLAA